MQNLSVSNNSMQGSIAMVSIELSNAKVQVGDIKSRHTDYSSQMQGLLGGIEKSDDNEVAVQIAALNVRTEAEAIAKRLSSKGYSAYVVAPASGTPAVYRVRVGKFPTRREAESIASRLKKEEQFNPWVTR